MGSKKGSLHGGPVVPTILYVILGYLVGRLFLTVYSLACDTSLQCFIISEVEKLGRCQVLTF